MKNTKDCVKEIKKIVKKSKKNARVIESDEFSYDDNTLKESGFRRVGRKKNE